MTIVPWLHVHNTFRCGVTHWTSKHPCTVRSNQPIVNMDCHVVFIVLKYFSFFVLLYYSATEPFCFLQFINLPKSPPLIMSEVPIFDYQIKCKAPLVPTSDSVDWIEKRSYVTSFQLTTGLAIDCRLSLRHNFAVNVQFQVQDQIWNSHKNGVFVDLDCVRSKYIYRYVLYLHVKCA